MFFEAIFQPWALMTTMFVLSKSVKVGYYQTSVPTVTRKCFSSVFITSHPINRTSFFKHLSPAPPRTSSLRSLQICDDNSVFSIDVKTLKLKFKKNIFTRKHVATRKNVCKRWIKNFTVNIHILCLVLCNFWVPVYNAQFHIKTIHMKLLADNWGWFFLPFYSLCFISVRDDRWRTCHISPRTKALLARSPWNKLPSTQDRNP